MEDFRCKTCANGPVEMERQKEISLGVDSGEKLDCVEKFCYLGDMIGAGGGAEEASRDPIH